MRYTIKEQVYALAGVFQAAVLVDSLARKGTILDQEAFEACIDSVFETSPESVEAVYGGFDRLALGKQMLKPLLNRQIREDHKSVLHYALSLIHIEKQLRRQPQLLEIIAQRLTRAKGQAEHFGSRYHENVIAGLDGIYQDTVSTLKTRIQIQGDRRQLEDKANTTKIRALLLAGVRSVMLWRQCGGSRLHFFTKKSALVKALG